MIYLDTHVVTWLYGGELSRLGRTARKWLDSDGDLVISPMVTLELQYLFEVKRLAAPALPILGYLQEKLGLAECRKAFSKVVEAGLLQTWTRDPFDRLIVAQASLAGDVLLTQDETIRRHYRRAQW